MNELSSVENSPEKEEKLSVIVQTSAILGSASVEDTSIPTSTKSPEIVLDIANEITRGPRIKTIENMDFSAWVKTNGLGQELVTCLEEEDLKSIDTLKSFPLKDINLLDLDTNQKAQLSLAIQNLCVKDDDSELGKWASENEINGDTLLKLKDAGTDSLEKLRKLTEENMKSLRIKAGQRVKLTKGIANLNDTEFTRILKTKNVDEDTIKILIQKGFDTENSFMLMEKEDILSFEILDVQKRVLVNIVQELKEGEENETKSSNSDTDLSKFLKTKQLNEGTIRTLTQKGYDTHEALMSMDEENVENLQISGAQKNIILTVLQELKWEEKEEEEPACYEDAYDEFLKKIGLTENSISKLKRFGMDSPEALMIINANLNELNLSTDQRNKVDDAIARLKHFHKDPDMKSTIAKVLESNRGNSQTSGDVVIGAFIAFVAKTEKVVKPSSANIAKYMNSVGAKGEPDGTVMENGMRIVKLPVKQVYEDTIGRIRKCIIGHEKSSYQQKTIMLVGATGAGKSCLINGMCNYIFDAKWTETNRYKLIDEHKDEKENVMKGQSMSQTEWITIYTINNGESNKLSSTLNLIDTPGFGDTRGLSRDEKLVEQIRALFKNGDDQGVECSKIESHGIDEIDAVCFVAKAPDARLTPSQRYIFSSIMSVFGKDIAKNILVMITFGDGAKPPVLEAINEAKLPFIEEFKFNNSALYANNGDAGIQKPIQTAVVEKNQVSTAFSKMFWDMGIQSFAAFFSFVEGLTPRSLHLTNEVLEQRRILKHVLFNLEEKVRIGLAKMEDLKKEEEILHENEHRMADNEDFTYTVRTHYVLRVPCKRFTFVSHCTVCQETCHVPCSIEDDDNRYQCDMIDKKTGNCLSCKGNCSWQSHTHTGYSLQSKTRPEKKTWEKKLHEYTEATKIVNKKRNSIAQINTQYGQCEADVRYYVRRCGHILTALKRIAMKPCSLTEVEYIEELIMTERDERRNGWQERVEHLEKFKQEAEILTKVRDEVILLPKK